MLKEKLEDIITSINVDLKENAPEIMTVAGVIGFVAAGVLAVVGTAKHLEKAKENTKKDILETKEKHTNDNGEIVRDNNFTKDIVSAYARTFGRFAKIYAFPVSLAVGSALLIFKSDNTMESRLDSSVAYGVAIKSAFDKYRNRVANKLGAEEEHKLYSGIVTEKCQVTENVDGKNKKVTKEYDVANPSNLGPYQFIYDEENFDSYQVDCGYDYHDLLISGTMSNESSLLRLKGFRYLQNVLDALGYKHQLSDIYGVGWLYDPANTINSQRDNCIRCYTSTVYVNVTDDFGNTTKVPKMLIEFNCDGEIGHLFKTKREIEHNSCNKVEDIPKYMLS